MKVTTAKTISTVTECPAGLCIPAIFSKNTKQEMEKDVQCNAVCINYGLNFEYITICLCLMYKS